MSCRCVIQDGIHDVRDSITAFVQRVREHGFMHELNFQRQHMNFDFNWVGGVGGGRHPAPRAGEPAPRSRRMSAEEVQMRVDALPTELYASDEDLQTRFVSCFVCWYTHCSPLFRSEEELMIVRAAARGVRA